MTINNLSENIVFITGAASGIGAAIAHAFAGQGCELILADLSEEGLAGTVAAVARLGAKAHPVVLDVTDEQQYQRVAEHIRNTVGVPHILVNNAGIGVHGSFLNTPIDAVRRVIDVNLYGVINGCHAFLPMMLEAGDDRHLVNIASLASISPMPNMSVYAASKYAVDGLTEVLAMELMDTNVAVTCVHPGVINTPIIQGSSYNSDNGAEQEKRLGDYYQAHGSDPQVVANGIVNAVQNGCAHLYVGAKAPETAILKRISPALTRKLAMGMARKIGYA
jgi:NAD(P)-dependent dehydrogenase (short-subunit alcohol dehydrogenase family)